MRTRIRMTGQDGRLTLEGSLEYVRRLGMHVKKTGFTNSGTTYFGSEWSDQNVLQAFRQCGVVRRAGNVARLRPNGVLPWHYKIKNGHCAIYVLDEEKLSLKTLDIYC